ncbi:MAG: WYL domain-containing protein [Candidatus Cryptobacteroides sp.]|nr:WYL domain-containing protein [Bacteroidales bacterium]MDY3963036.1 WYL domain-containing protein [Candidatus Cryptobacteroides sp.]
MVTELINKYVWLIRTISKAGMSGLSLEDIQSKWENRWGTSYARRSFCNHRDAIEDVFGIKIECDRSRNRYFIRYSDDVEDQADGTAWLVNTFTVNSLLELGRERLSGRVSVENIPSGQKYLTDLMAAMLDNSQVRIEYRKYSSDLSEQLTVCPYALKEDMKRWYLVGYSLERDALRVYSLDRIVELKVLETKFRLPRNFDIDELFRDSYGVYLSENEEPQSIVLECDTEQARFLDGLPLHRSQRITWLTSKARVAIRVVPNPRLIMDLCALGPRIKVLSPDSVRDAVRESHRKALEE